MSIRRLLAALVLLPVLALVPVGCGSDDPAKPEPTPEITFASTAELTTAFKKAFEEGDGSLLAAALADDFAYLLGPETRATFPSVGDTLSRGQMLQIGAALAGGQEITNFLDDVVPAVGAVTIPLLTQGAGWETIPDGQPYAGLQVASFEIVFMVDRPSYASIQCSGVLRLIVVPTDDIEPTWKLQAIQDLTGNVKSSENTALGNLLCLYWEGDGS